MHRKMNCSIVALALAVMCVAGACSADDGAKSSTTTSASTEVSTITLDADQAARVGLEEGDELTVKTVPTIVVEDSTTIPAATQTANEQFIEETLGATGLADDEGEKDFPSYSSFAVPGGYVAEGPDAWLADTMSSDDEIVLNASSWLDYRSSLQVAPRAGEPEAVLTTHLADGGYDRTCATHGAVTPYDDGRVTGVTKTYSDCSGGLGGVTLIAGRIAGDSSGTVILIDATVSEPRDVRALTRVLATVNPAA